MEDKLALFFFNFFIPATLGFGSLYIWTTLHGDERANSAFILLSLSAICMHYLYKNTLELFKNLRNRK